jgi:hypothetical protein
MSGSIFLSRTGGDRPAQACCGDHCRCREHARRGRKLSLGHIDCRSDGCTFSAFDSLVQVVLSTSEEANECRGQEETTSTATRRAFVSTVKGSCASEVMYSVNAMKWFWIAAMGRVPGRRYVVPILDHRGEVRCLHFLPLLVA